MSIKERIEYNVCILIYKWRLSELFKKWDRVSKKEYKQDQREIYIYIKRCKLERNRECCYMIDLKCTIIYLRRKKDLKILRER